MVRTITILQLDKQCVLVDEVIEISNDIVMMQDGEDAYLIHDISSLLVREVVKIYFLPNHQRVILKKD